MKVKDMQLVTEINMGGCVRPSRFIRGPIPLEWAVEAGRLGGSALRVGLALWFYRGIRKSPSFRLGVGDIASATGLHPDSARRGLRALELAGLVEVERRNGRKSGVTITGPELYDRGATKLQAV